MKKNNSYRNYKRINENSKENDCNSNIYNKAFLKL